MFDRETIELNNIKQDFSLIDGLGPIAWIPEAKITIFSEYGHVAYKIKGCEIYKNMQAKIFPLQTPSTSGMGQKVETDFFLKVVMLHIKLKAIKHRTPYKQLFCPYSFPQPLSGVKKSTQFVSESGHVPC